MMSPSCLMWRQSRSPSLRSTRHSKARRVWRNCSSRWPKAVPTRWRLWISACHPDGMAVETITHLWHAYPNLQVVVCTAYSDYSWNDIQRRLGQSENLLILKKPFDNIEVIQLAHALTRKWLVSGQAQARLEDLDLMVAERTAELRAANQRIKREFEEKAAAEEAFRSANEFSPIAIALSDLNGRYVDMNRAMEELMAVPKASVIGRDTVELGWIESRENCAAIRRALDEGRGVD